MTTRVASALGALAGLHERGLTVAFARTWPGRVAIWVLAWLLLRPFDHSAVLLPAIVVATLVPSRRRLVLAGAGLFVLAEMLLARRGLTLGGLAEARPQALVHIGLAGALLLGASLLGLRAARSLSAWPTVLRRRPLIVLHATLLATLAVLWLLPARTEVWRALRLTFALLPFLAWRVGYLIVDARRGKLAGTHLTDHLGWLWPAFGGTDVPFGKGHDALSRWEAQDGEGLARAQLAGLKLLVLAWLWQAALRAMDAVVHGSADNVFARMAGGRSLDVPYVGALLQGSSSASTPMTWLALYVELVRATLALAVVGHVIVGALRLVGFNAWRNTYKPLLAETVLDFWNRYYYYFKELLLDLFFYPVYLRWFRTRPRLRTFAAIFAAAFLGNAYYHVLRDRAALVDADWAAVWAHQGPRLVYCFLLALGIFLSMERQRALRGATRVPSPWEPAHRVRRILGVWTFFALIHVWSLPVGGTGFAERLALLGRLIGL